MPREGIMVGALTILAYVNSVSPSCVYFITISRLRKQTSAESEHSNQNQKPKCRATNVAKNSLAPALAVFVKKSWS